MQLGPRRAAEEITAQLDRIYEALIAPVHCYGGSVVGFVGDAVTCWFDNLSPGGKHTIENLSNHCLHINKASS